MVATWNFVLPHNVQGEATSRNYGRFIISPLESGYGLTLGTALRRVLLSSLPGAAVTSLRVSDVHHEFSAIPGVREDMTQLLLQVKQLRLQLFDTAETARLRLEHHGEGTVTAADIICPSDVEIINSDLYLFTVDEPNQTGSEIVNAEMLYFLVAPRRRPRPGTVFLAPRSVRALVRVRWPRTGKLRRCRSPR